MKMPRRVNDCWAWIVGLAMVLTAGPTLAQLEVRECEPQTLASMQVLLKNAKKHWIDGDRDKAVEVAFQAWQSCPSYIPSGLEYADFLVANGHVNEAVDILTTLDGGYPGQLRLGVALKLGGIHQTYGSLSLVVKGKAGYLESLGVEVELTRSGMTRVEKNMVEEIQDNYLVTPAIADRERVFYLVPGSYQLKVYLDDDDYPNPGSLEKTADGRAILDQRTVNLSPGELTRVEIEHDGGGDRNNIFLVLVGGLAWLMFR